MPRRRSRGRSRPSPFDLALLQRPQTTNGRIVFQWFLNNYNKNEFNPIACQGRVTEQDVDRVFAELSKSEHWLPAVKPWPLLAGLGIGAVVMIVFMILFVNGMSSNTSKNTEPLEPGQTRPRTTTNMTSVIFFPIGMCLCMCIVIGCSCKMQSDFLKRLKTEKLISLGY